mgnify:CR=1 FL=1
MQKQSENAIQQQIVRWYKNTYCLKHHNPRCMIFHVPNQMQQRFVSIGLLPGVSDLIINHNGQWVCIEVKDHKGKLSEAQEDFAIRVETMGTKYYMVRSLNEFIEAVSKL